MDPRRGVWHPQPDEQRQAPLQVFATRSAPIRSVTRSACLAEVGKPASWRSAALASAKERHTVPAKVICFRTAGLASDRSIPRLWD